MAVIILRKHSGNVIQLSMRLVKASETKHLIGKPSSNVRTGTGSCTSCGQCYARLPRTFKHPFANHMATKLLQTRLSSGSRSKRAHPMMLSLLSLWIPCHKMLAVGPSGNRVFLSHSFVKPRGHVDTCKPRRLPAPRVPMNSGQVQRPPSTAKDMDLKPLTCSFITHDSCFPRG